MSAPAFQFYVADWALSVASMTLEERGAHITLLAWSWDNGPVPNDAKRIAAILGTHIGHARRVWAEVSKRWTLTDDGQWQNARLERVRASSIKFREGRTENGRAGGTSRWKSPEPRNNARQTRSERLTTARQKGTHTEAEWLEMIEVYEFKCLVCGCVPEGRPCKDHILPIYLGGSDSIQNLQPMCRECNTSKGPDRTDHRLRHPSTLPKWLPKQGISEDVNQTLNVKQTPSSPISDLRSPTPLRQERSEGGEQRARAIPPDADLAIVMTPAAEDVVSALAPAWEHRAAGASVRPGGLVGKHLKCLPATAAACARGICVPPFLAEQWLTQFDPDRELPDVAQSSVRAFVEGVIAELPSRGGVGEPKDFWNAQWSAAHRPKTSIPMTTKVGRNVSETKAAEEYFNGKLGSR